jgi:hypothetical protein
MYAYATFYTKASSRLQLKSSQQRNTTTSAPLGLAYFVGKNGWVRMDIILSV